MLFFKASLDLKVYRMSDFFYSDKYEDDNYEYRHVHVPKVSLHD